MALPATKTTCSVVAGGEAFRLLRHEISEENPSSVKVNDCSGCGRRERRMEAAESWNRENIMKTVSPYK